MAPSQRESRCILFDWGDTLMRVFPDYDGPMAAWPRVEAMPHAVDVLTELHKEFLLGVATNAADSDEAEIRAALARVGLDPLLDRIYCHRSLGHKKPSQEYFEAVLADLGLEPDRVVMVGDDFAADVVGANRSGIRAIWYNPYTSEERENDTYQTVHDLGRLLHVATIRDLIDERTS